MRDNMRFAIYAVLYMYLFSGTLFASTFSASVVDKVSRVPIEGAVVGNSLTSVKTDAKGDFSIKGGDGAFFVKACGYRPLRLSNVQNIQTVELEPLIVKALYLSFWRASNSSPRLKEIVEIIDKTDINAIVVDVKNEYGSTSFLTSFKKANSYGAHENRTNRDIDAFMELMRSKKIYTIARIVTFKDELQASNNPTYAIKKSDGTLWRNHDGMAWVDPFDKRAHDYTLSIAEEAAKVGFDEINFDYIRFPAKEGLVLSKESTQTNRIGAINGFLRSARERLSKYGVMISVDTYGNICWEEGDVGIGQSIEAMAEYADYISPMLYPSGFAKGSFGVEYPSEHPHAVIYKSLKNVHDKIAPKRLRPWLQSFKDYAHRKVDYGYFEINEQIRASKDANAGGWMLWSPSSRYDLAYFSKRGENVLTLDLTRANPEHID